MLFFLGSYWAFPCKSGHDTQNFKIIVQHQIWCHIKAKGVNFTILKSEPQFLSILIVKNAN